MREMIKELEEKPTVENAEDRLSLHAMTPKERRAAKKAMFSETISGMSAKEKFSYVVFYYKWYFIAVVAVLLIALSLSITIYKNSRPISLSYVVINQDENTPIDTAPIEKYIEDMGMTDGYRLLSNTEVQLDPETYLEEFNNNPNSSIYTEFPMMCYNGFYDVIITDEKGARYCGMQDIAYHVDLVLDADIYSVVQERVFIAPDNNGDNQKFAIDISDTEFAKSLNLSYDKVYIAFPGSYDNNLQSAKRLMRYIFDIEVEE